MIASPDQHRARTGPAMPSPLPSLPPIPPPPAPPPDPPLPLTDPGGPALYRPPVYAPPPQGSVGIGHHTPGTPWPIGLKALAALIDLDLTTVQIAAYFRVRVDAIEALRRRYRI